MKKIQKMIVSILAIIVLSIPLSADTSQLKIRLVPQKRSSQKLNFNFIQIEKYETETIYYTFLDTAIAEPHYYRLLIKFLREAEASDTFIVNINTYGGNAFTAVQIYNAIKNTKAKTIARVYNAQSAGCMIMLACDKIEAKDFAMVMMHQWSGGDRGEISDMESRYLAYNRLMKKMLKKMCNGFFTKKEINKMLAGGEVYLVDDEIKERAKKWNQKHK